MDVAGGVLDRPLADRAGVHSGDHLRGVRAGGLSEVRRRGGLRGDGRCAWRTCMYAVCKRREQRILCPKVVDVTCFGVVIGGWC